MQLNLIYMTLLNSNQHQMKLLRNFKKNSVTWCRSCFSIVKASAFRFFLEPAPESSEFSMSSPESSETKIFFKERKWLMLLLSVYFFIDNKWRKYICCGAKQL